ncbi:MAG: family N-acetyltransferase [Frondihabitans sp.]|nr:family N-acetyltransferase [Frondihabitans sp.]
MTTSPSSSPITVSLATESDRAVLEQLWTMFRHEMSAYSGVLPDAHGRFRQERLDNALERDDWRAYLIRLESTPIGLCIVRDLGSPEQVISSFFLVKAARGSGYGRTAVRAVTAQHRGRWAVAFQDANTAAVAFWRTIAADADPTWTSEHVSVAGRPDLPADSWIRFQVR